MADNSIRRTGAAPEGAINSKSSGFHITPGIYVGTVVGVSNNLNGQLFVTIPEVSIEGLSDPSQGLPVNYASPYYGTTYGTDSGLNPDSPATSGQSYGMWMVPPDIGNQVLVVFTGGDVSRDGYWFACIYNGPSHHMVPGIARDVSGSAATKNPSDALTPYLDSNSNLPVVEYDTATATNLLDQQGTPRYPHEPQTMTYIRQGLDRDKIRGAISSSSLRESPSNVYGISTPGKKATTTNQSSTNPQIVFFRQGGHTFVMDDGTSTPDPSPAPGAPPGVGTDQLIRLRSSGGHQILMNDTQQILYISSGSGNQWLEFSNNGQINVYGIGGFNMRTKGPMNFHSESAINMHAKTVKIEGEISAKVSTGGFLDLVSLGKLSIGAGGAVSMSAGGFMSIAAGAKMNIGAIGPVNIDGALLMLNSGTPPIPIPPLPAVPKTHEDTTFDGHRWVVNDVLLSTCTVVPSHEPWKRP